MSSDLKLFDLYDNCDDSEKRKFMEQINSKVELKVDYDKLKTNNKWVEIIEETLPYISNALAKPNRLLNNNEEILQIEKTKKVTVDSIKHLSKHTNLIQDIDKDDNVIPMKILNVLKEESFATYENRFIFTLIKKVNDFISNKKEKAIQENQQSYREDKSLKYAANTVVGKEMVDIEISINSNTNAKTGETTKSKNEDILGKIEELEKKMLELTATQNYKLFEKSRFLLITPPLKMTNALLKNPNLQCAVKLWNYLMDTVDNNTEREQNTEVFENNSKLKKFIDESFLLNYIILNNYNKKKTAKEEEKYIEILIEDILDKTLSLDDNISEEQIQKIINRKYKVIRNKIVVKNMEIEGTYKKAINKYITKISKVQI